MTNTSGVPSFIKSSDDLAERRLLGRNRLIQTLSQYREQIGKSDLRVGQLIMNAMIWGQRGEDPYFIEDDELAYLIERYLYQQRPAPPGAWVDGA